MQDVICQAIRAKHRLTVHQKTPYKMLSRVVSLDWFGSLGLTPFGLLLVGAISGLAPPGEIIAAGAAISMCIIACGLFSKQIRTID